MEKGSRSRSETEQQKKGIQKNLPPPELVPPKPEPVPKPEL